MDRQLSDQLISGMRHEQAWVMGIVYVYMMIWVCLILLPEFSVFLIIAWASCAGLGWVGFGLARLLGIGADWSDLVVTAKGHLYVCVSGSVWSAATQHGSYHHHIF